MNLPVLIGSLLTITMIANSSVSAAQLLYLASSKDKTIVAYSVNPDSGELNQQFAVELPGNAGPLAFSPDGKFVYAAVTGLADKKAGVSTFSRADDGSLKLISTAHLTSRAPYIRADKSGKFLLAAHYGDGDVTVYRIADGVFTGELLDQKMTAKTAHCIEVDPSGQFVFVPHTSPNKVFQFKLNGETGKLTPNESAAVDGPDEDHLYHQPRHYAHHPKLSMAYTSNERGGGISAWNFDPKKGTLTLQQTLSTLPADFKGNSAAADIHITPNGKFAYVSNRDVTRREKGETTEDTLAAVALDAKSGKMKVVGTYPTAHLPRSFCIDLTGNFVYSAGQGDATLIAYRIDQKSGALTQLAKYETGGVPIWVMCGAVK